MSNATDVLLIGGPSHGRFVCNKLPMPATFVVYSDLGDATYANYKRLHKELQKWFHLALPYPIDVEPPGAQLDAYIDYYGHQPAWDLNPMLGPSGQAVGEL